ncbi:hypothetical protein B0H14DRAFT_3563873 [Mycena olivaceomarginata]|nr:hypothetical protein B0H14DRAFT_3563873 [Mycena olivaceomarginata]
MDNRHFYVNELARCRDGPFVIPLCWVLFKGEMHADAMVVTVDGDGTAHVNTTEILIRAADLLDNYLDFGHIGAKGNRFCRKCKTDAGFHSMFDAGVPHSAAETLTELHEQVELACLGVKAAVEARQTDTGVKDSYTNHWINDLLRRSRELKKADPNLDSAQIVQQLKDWVKQNESTIYNPFLSLRGFDVSKDTPIEILHTILLGIVKYAWHSTHTSWTPVKKVTYTLRLQATNTTGLSIPSIRANYIMQFANSLIGRQFKQVAQTCIFHMHDLVDGLQFTAWKAMGELLPLLWYPEIDNMDQYLVDVETAISNILDIFAALDPTKILAKNKLHILTHAKADILRHAPSRDIAHQLAHQEGLKHRLTGGWWLSSSTGNWECAGWAVRDFLSQRPILQTLLGWTSPIELEQGSVKLTPLKRVKGQPTPPRPEFTLAQTDAKIAMNIVLYNPDLTWQRCIHVVSKSRDVCPLLSWVYVICPVTNQPTFGRIKDIFTSAAGSVVILDVFSHFGRTSPNMESPQIISSTRRTDSFDSSFHISQKARILNSSSTSSTIVTSAKCIASGSRAKKQERVDSNITEAFIEHLPLEEHVINTTAFHNAHLLRRCLPRSAWAPVPMFTPEDRLTKHNELAEQLRGKHSSKKAAKAAAAAAQAAVTVEATAVPRAEGSAAAASEGTHAAMATGTEQNMVAEGGEDRTNEDASGVDGNIVPAGSTAIPTKRKRGRPPKNTTSTAGSSTTQKEKGGTNGKKGKAANPAKKTKTPGNCRRNRRDGFRRRSGRYFQ